MADSKTNSFNKALIGLWRKAFGLKGDALAFFAPGSEALYDGTQATSTSGAPLNGGNSQAVSEVVVTNLDASIKMFVGSADSQNTPLAAGASMVVPVNDLNKIYVRSASGTPTVAWLGRS